MLRGCEGWVFGWCGCEIEFLVMRYPGDLARWACNSYAKTRFVFSSLLAILFSALPGNMTDSLAFRLQNFITICSFRANEQGSIGEGLVVCKMRLSHISCSSHASRVVRL